MAIHRTKAKRVLSEAILFSILAVPSLAFAALVVIYASGETHPLASFLEVFDEGFDQALGD